MKVAVVGAVVLDGRHLAFRAGIDAAAARRSVAEAKLEFVRVFAVAGMVLQRKRVASGGDSVAALVVRVDPALCNRPEHPLLLLCQVRPREGAVKGRASVRPVEQSVRWVQETFVHHGLHIYFIRVVVNALTEDVGQSHVVHVRPRSLRNREPAWDVQREALVRVLCGV